MFKKSERSTFKYWFAHWCAFQMVALNHRCWKWKYLFHDIEKPWLRLIWKDYKKVQGWHRLHNSHHIEHFLKYKEADWLAMAIDWECSKYTKEASPLNARGEMIRQFHAHPEYYNILMEHMMPVLMKYNF